MPRSGRDYHFTSTPLDAERSLLRMGYGPGPLTEKNRRWTRDDAGHSGSSDEFPVRHYFEKGCIYVIFQTSIDGDLKPDRPSLTDE